MPAWPTPAATGVPVTCSPSQNTSAAAPQGGQESHVSRLIHVPPTPVPMAASAYPLSLPTSVAARRASMAPPAGKTLTSAARTLGCAATEAPVTMRSAPIAVPAAPPTLVPTVNYPMCPAAPHPARTGAPAALRETPPTSVPACQALLDRTVKKMWMTVQETAARMGVPVWMA